MTERSDFFNRNIQAELDRQEATAAKYGYVVRNEGNALFTIVHQGQTLAQCNLKASAVRVAYALASTFAMPDPLGEALNSGDGTYRP